MISPRPPAAAIGVHTAAGVGGLEATELLRGFGVVAVLGVLMLVLRVRVIDKYDGDGAARSARAPTVSLLRRGRRRCR